MTPIDQMPNERLIAQLERWIERIDQERDWLGQLLDRGEVSPVERAFVEARLVANAAERTEVAMDLEQQQGKRNKAQFILPERPRIHRQLKVSARRRFDERKRA